MRTCFLGLFVLLALTGTKAIQVNAESITYAPDFGFVLPQPYRIYESTLEAYQAEVRGERTRWSSHYYGRLYQLRHLKNSPTDFTARFLKKCVESRIIVSRKRDAETPTWDGKVPAIIVDPFIWYFKLDSEGQTYSSWPSTTIAIREDKESTARRTIGDSLLERHLFFENDPTLYFE